VYVYLSVVIYRSRLAPTQCRQSVGMGRHLLCHARHGGAEADLVA